MNRSYLAFHLVEALEELTSILSDLKGNEEYSEEDFTLAMEHLYHHVNFAWNTRNLSANEVEGQDMDHFYLRRQFPKDIRL